MARPPLRVVGGHGGPPSPPPRAKTLTSADLSPVALLWRHVAVLNAVTRMHRDLNSDDEVLEALNFAADLVAAAAQELETPTRPEPRANATPGSPTST